MHRAGDVFQALLAEIVEGEVEAAGGVFLDAGRDADAAGLGERLEARGDIDAVAEDVAILDDNVADIDADAELDAVVRYAGVALGHRLLPVGRAAQRVDDAGEFDEEAVAGGFDDAAAMFGDRRVDQRRAERFQAIEGALLVLADEARIAGDIGCQDRRQPAFGAIALRRFHRGSA